MAAPTPLVVLPACRLDKEGQSYHTIGDKYVRAVAEAAGCLPVMLPSLGSTVSLNDVLARADGIVLTGSPSNVHPTHYGQDPNPKAEPHDRWRDDVTLPLIRRAVAEGIPLFAICRGMQELNVALGGTLFARVHEEPERMDHRRPQDPDLDVQYGPRHRVAIARDGLLRRILDQDHIMVNSLHWQAVDRVAEGLHIEATAEDGTVEALSMPGATGFVLGVQWHPEYKPEDNPDALRLFAAFAEAARARAAQRAALAGAPTAAA